MLPLPLLASLQPRADEGGPHPLVVLRFANGVAQAGLDEPDAFWPSSAGPLTSASLAAESSRAASVLSPYASQLLFVKGLRYPFGATSDLHAGGGNQMLTAARPGPNTGQSMTYAQGESIDNLVARSHPNNGGEPLTLFTGRRSGLGQEILSYRGPGDLRAAEDDPYTAYQRFLGGTGPLGRRQSINDLVLEELNGLLAGGSLSEIDRQHLQLHADAVRDFEVLCERLSAEQEDEMQGLVGLSTSDEHRLTIARLHCDLAAIVLHCDAARAITIQMGDSTDTTRYSIDGQLLPEYHSVSHRTEDATLEGAPIEGAFEMHHAVDKLHLSVFLHLLDRMQERDLLTRSVVLFGSDIARGPDHSYENLPVIVAGTGDGTLLTGRVVEVAETTNNHLLNTLLTATGLRTSEGGPIEDFGDLSLPGGLLDEISSG